MNIFDCTDGSTKNLAHIVTSSSSGRLELITVTCCCSVMFKTTSWSTANTVAEKDRMSVTKIVTSIFCPFTLAVATVDTRCLKIPQPLIHRSGHVWWMTESLPGALWHLLLGNTQHNSPFAQLPLLSISHWFIALLTLLPLAPARQTKYHSRNISLNVLH